MCRLRAVATAVPRLNVGSGRSSLTKRPEAAVPRRSHFTSPALEPHHRTSILSSQLSISPAKTKTATPRNRRGALYSTMHKAPAAKITVPVTDPNVTIRTPRDPNTLSNYHNFLTKHTVADFEINFEKKLLDGGVELTFESLTDGEAKEIVLDTRLVCLRSLNANRLRSSSAWSQYDFDTD